MNLEHILEAVTHARHTRGISWERRIERMNTSLSDLETYQGERLTHRQLAYLDSAAIMLKRERRDDLSGLIERIDAVREPYRPSQPLATYDLISTNNATYGTRMERIETFLDTNATSYDDLALTKDWLETNSYLKRKRAHNPKFDARVSQLEKRLKWRMNPDISQNEEKHYSVPDFERLPNPPEPGYVSRIMTTVVASTSAALIALSALPTVWFAPLYT